MLLDSIAVNNFDSIAENITNFSDVVRAILERNVFIKNDSLTAVNKRLQRINLNQGYIKLKIAQFH